MGRRERSIPTRQHPAAILGATLRQARQTRGIRLSELARRLNYTKGHLSAVETGVAWPSPELVEAYERTLELPPGELMRVAGAVGLGRRSSSTGSLTSVGDLLARVRQGVGYAAEAETLVEPPAGPSTPAQRGHPNVLRDVETALSWAAELIEDAAREPAPPGGEILLTSQGWTGAISPVSEASARWRQALRTALARGWDVVHLYRLDPAEHNHLALVAEMLALLGFAGRYRAYSLPPAPPPPAPSDLLVIPGKGAMQFLATQQQRYVDAAMFYTDREQVAMLHDHFEILRAQATPILKIYRILVHAHPNPRPELDLLRYDDAYTHAETRPGDRFLVKEGLSTLLLPGPLFQEMVRRVVKARGDDWHDWARALIENRLQRVAAFHEQVKTFHFRDICSKRAIEKLVMAGTYCDQWLQTPPLSVQGVPIDPGSLYTLVPAEERAKRLQAVIDTLKTYPNYELGLLDDEAASDTAETYWEIKGKEWEGTLFLGTWCPEGESWVEVELEITQPVVVEAFRAYFHDLWKSLPAENREKEHVIAWLQAQLARIPTAFTP